MSFFIPLQNGVFTTPETEDSLVVEKIRRFFMMKMVYTKMVAVLLLCGCILFGCADNGSGGSDNAEQNPLPSGGNAGTSEKIVLHAYNYINVYTWGTDNEALNAVHSPLSNEGQGWYGITLDTGYACIIFTKEYNYWTDQTDNLDRTSGEWWYKDRQWYSSKPNSESTPSGNTGGNSGESGGGSGGVWSSNIYLEIMSFSYKTNDFNGGTFIKLDSSTTEEFKRKLNTEYTMATLGTTKLYYSFHKALTNLSNYQFPDNLKSVNIITFTDGLDLASSGPSWEDTEFDSAEEYGAWIKNEIETRTISGLKLNCHSVGVQGEDLNGQTDLFKKSLSFITSNGNTPYIESDITKVAEAFSSIANNLTVRQTLYDLTLEIPRGATVVRMVFDGFDGMSSMDALRSRVYLEGTISNKTIEITAHPGLILETDKVSGTPMYDKEGFDMGNDSYPFRNMQFTDDASNYVDVSNHKFNKDTCKQFYKSSSSSSFIQNSEYDASEHCDTVEDKFSTVIYLILDATSSLGKENVEEVRKAAINFVDTLAEKAQAGN